MCRINVCLTCWEVGCGEKWRETRTAARLLTKLAHLSSSSSSSSTSLLLVPGFLDNLFVLVLWSFFFQLGFLVILFLPCMVRSSSSDYLLILAPALQTLHALCLFCLLPSPGIFIYCFPSSFFVVLLLPFHHHHCYRLVLVLLDRVPCLLSSCSSLSARAHLLLLLVSFFLVFFVVVLLPFIIIIIIILFFLIAFLTYFLLVLVCLPEHRALPWGSATARSQRCKSSRARQTMRSSRANRPPSLRVSMKKKKAGGEEQEQEEDEMNEMVKRIRKYNGGGRGG